MPGATLKTVQWGHFHRHRACETRAGLDHVTEERPVSRNAIAALRAVIVARGKETRGAGDANATVEATLHELDGGTRVQVTTDLAITGKPAQFGMG